MGRKSKAQIAAEREAQERARMEEIKARVEEKAKRSRERDAQDHGNLFSLQ